MDENVSMPAFTLTESAAGIHEVYLAYLEAGFDKNQAFDLAKTTLTTILERSLK